ncbi:MAG: AtpZ/AtpI family protein [Acidobacteriota bacterium]|nr:AtpZ/AtpI family protein [Acidobacteriota bacterium]
MDNGDLQKRSQGEFVRKKRDNSLIWLGKYISLGLTLPASVVAGYILGTFADRWLHVPILRVVGIFLGMAAGVTQIIRELNRDSRK